jgi:hypothetical protein
MIKLTFPLSHHKAPTNPQQKPSPRRGGGARGCTWRWVGVDLRRCITPPVQNYQDGPWLACDRF